MSPIDKLPDDLESLKRLLAAERMARIDAEAKAANAEAAVARAVANVSSAEALITHLKLAIEKMRRELYGSHSERGRKLLDQMELELEDLEATAAEDKIAAEKAAAKTGDGSTRSNVGRIVPCNFRDLLRAVGGTPEFDGRPNEVPDPVPFARIVASGPMTPMR
jgi:hypothetical protein